MTPPTKLSNPPASRESLRWLFRAEFADGHVIEQDPDDTCHSRTDGTGSAFTDVLAYGKPVIFGLYNVENPSESAIVDLITGNFSVNGTALAIHNQMFEPQNYSLELVYFRESRANMTVVATVQEDGSIKQEKVGNTQQFVNRYFIGWQTTIHGKTKQSTIAVG